MTNGNKPGDWRSVFGILLCALICVGMVYAAHELSPPPKPGTVGMLVWGLPQ